MQVNRIHDDFVWLHDQLEENEAFAGFIVRFSAHIVDKFIGASCSPSSRLWFI